MEWQHPVAFSAGSFKSSEPQELDVVVRRSVERELGDDLADDRGELEAVAREAGGDDGRGALRMQVDEEMLVGTVLEEACLQRDGWSRAGREVALDEGVEQGRQSSGWGARSSSPRTATSPTVVGDSPDLNPGTPKTGKAVTATLGHREVEDRKPLRVEELRFEGLERGEHLSFRGDGPGGSVGHGRPDHAPAQSTR